jgi:hypothetical protein
MVLVGWWLPLLCAHCLPGRTALAIDFPASLQWPSALPKGSAQFILLHANILKSGHALRHKTAGQFGPDLAKKLSQLVKMEKNVMRSMELVGRERMEVAVS